MFLLVVQRVEAKVRFPSPLTFAGYQLLSESAWLYLVQSHKRQKPSQFFRPRLGDCQGASPGNLNFGGHLANQ